MAKGRQPPKAKGPPKKNTYRTSNEAAARARAFRERSIEAEARARAFQKMCGEAIARARAVQEEAAEVRKKVDQYLARVQAVQKANDFVARARAVQKKSEEAIRMADESLGRSRAQSASWSTIGLGALPAALAIGEAGRQTYYNSQQRQAAAQRAERGGARARRSNLEILPAVATQENQEL